MQAGPTCPVTGGWQGRTGDPERVCKIQTDKQTEKYREVEEGKGDWMGRTGRTGKQETSG